MPKASLTLANGTVVTIDGTVPEIHELLSFYGSRGSKPPNAREHNLPTLSSSPKINITAEDNNGDELDLMTIVNQIKSCGQAENIEKNILDRPDQLARVLLPMYIVYEHLNNGYGLTSGQISKVTIQLSVPVKLPNASKILSTSASKYVIGDTVRKNGQAVKYKLSRRGYTYMKEVIDSKNL
jgi:hypothetical protein